MNQDGVRAVARDTGGRRAQAHKKASSATATEVQLAPSTNRSATTSRGATSKLGRPFVLITALPPVKPAAWYRTAGRGPCGHCGGRIIRRLERNDGTAAIRVAHSKDCEAKA